MATKVVMEALSPTMEEGRLVKWLKNEGDKVSSGETLAEVETDKAVMELVARGEGVLRKRLLGEGATAPVGQLVAVIAAPDENIDALVGDGGAAAPAPKQAKPAEEVVAKTQEKAGASPVPPKAEQSQGEASTPPPQKVPAFRMGSTAPRGQAPPSPEPATEQPRTEGNGEDRARTSPLARRLARESGLDIQSVRGTGPGGRIIKRDIEAAVASGGAQQPQGAVAPTPAREGDFFDVALTPMRKTIARRLSESIGPIPTFYLTADFDMERVVEMRTAMVQMGDEFKVSVNDIVMKAVATALSLHPEVNAHWLGDRIRQFNRVHLGMAVAVEDGLITPVIFDADRKRMSDISREARELAKRARERRLKPDEYMGATFSVSNLGMFGIDHFTAIINPPESGILAVGAVEQRPVVVNGQLGPRQRMQVTMSCDHRVVDGATGARFLQTLRRMLENPLMLVY
ncbi:MAG: pyruvate dehydrogenase complex dihydrolipoamide acetyltransferase [Gemmatimonadaceae bacterium]